MTTALILKWKRLGSDLPMPRRVRPEEAGHDLAVIVTPEMRGENFAPPVHPDPADPPRITVYPGALVNFATGWAVEIPPSHYGQIRVRSSIGKARWFLASSGAVDPNFRGEIKVPMLYLGAEPFTVTHGDRLAQMMIIAPWSDDTSVLEMAGIALLVFGVIVGVRALPGRGATFTTEDGQVWIQTDTQRVTYPTVPFPAELKPGAMGSYFLVPKDRRAVRVRQQRD